VGLKFSTQLNVGYTVSKVKNKNKNVFPYLIKEYKYYIAFTKPTPPQIIYVYFLFKLLSQS